MPRRRDTTINTLPAMLAEIDRYARSVDGALRDGSEAPQLDCHWLYTYIAPSGKRIGVERGQLDGTIDGWPLPGIYEADYVDSQDVSVVVEPWRGEQIDPEVLREAMKRGAEKEDPSAALFEEYRIQLRNLRAELNGARTREASVRTEYNNQVDIAPALQRTKNDAVATAAKAVADKELAEARQKEAEDALDHLERELATFKPQIQVAADRLIERVTEAFGGSDAMMLAPESASNGSHGSNGAAHPPQPDPDADPAPPGADDPGSCMEDLLAATVFDMEVARELHANGILSWETIRALVWCKTHKDLGPEPNWGDDAAPPPAATPGADAGVEAG